jgi:putative transposase
MPQKLVVRTFAERGYYHVFNRGNNKQTIFLDDEDYHYFTTLLFKYLSKERAKNSHVCFYGSIELIAYCLMPNHFHLLLHQLPERVISEFLRVLTISYTAYFNKKYSHIGHVLQGKFKARLIEDDSDLLNVSRYIHNNAKDITRNVVGYSYSSAQFYCGDLKPPHWLHTKHIFSILHGGFGIAKNKLRDSYKSFLLM